MVDGRQRKLIRERSIPSQFHKAIINRQYNINLMRIMLTNDIVHYG